MFCEPIPIVTKHIYRIVFPTSFHRTISNLIHATTITRHIEDYKTLRLRLFWPKLRSDIYDWIKKIFSLYAYLSLATKRTIINVFLTCQLSIHYPTCRFMDARPSY